MSENKDLPIRHAKSRHKTIVGSFCLAQVDEALFAWVSGLCICRSCLGFATDEVAKSKKLNELGTDLKQIATSLKVKEKTATPVTQAETVREIQRILSDNTPTPDEPA
jgi:hypothetical protein